MKQQQLSKNKTKQKGSFEFYNTTHTHRAMLNMKKSMYLDELSSGLMQATRNKRKTATAGQGQENSFFRLGARNHRMSEQHR